MAITSSDIKWYKSVNISDTTPASNGGVMSNVQSVTNVRNNVWPDVSQTERTTGSTKYRKMFIKINSDPSVETVNCNLFINSPSTGDDFVTLHYTGSQTDDQADLSSPRHYGIGTLKNSASLGATAITVTLEHADAVSLAPFVDDDKLCISNKDDITSSGNTEYLTIDTVSYVGNDAVIQLTSGTTFAWTVGATPIKVSSVIEIDSVVAHYTGATITSTSGTFDDVNGIVLNGTGCVEQTWTVTFTSSTAFTLSGDTLGSSLTTGSINSDFTYTNTDFSKPYFKLLSAEWGGTWATNDTLVFTTHPAAVPYWEKRIIPAGSASIANTGSRIAFSGESL